MTTDELRRALAITAARYWADRLRRIMQHPGAGVDLATVEAVRSGPPDAINLISIHERLQYIERGKLTEERIQIFEAELVTILEEAIRESLARGRTVVDIRNGYEPHPLINEAARRSEIGNAVTGYTMTLLPSGSRMQILLVEIQANSPGTFYLESGETIHVDPNVDRLEPGVFVYVRGETAAGCDQLPLISE